MRSTRKHLISGSVVLRLFFACLFAVSFSLNQTRATPSTPPSPIVITDASGKEIRLPALPQRLAVVGRGPQYLLHLLYMFPEGPDRLVGMEQRGRTASDFLTALFPGIDAKLTLLPNPGPEAVAALHPDLVLMKGSGADPLAEALAKVGIPTAFLNLETPEEHYRDIANLGVLLGNKVQADRIISFYRKNVERVETALSGLGDGEKPSVLVAMGNLQRGKYAVHVPARPWMQTYQVRAGGGRPVWLDAAERAGGWAVVNLEQIAAWDPDRIVFIVWYSVDAAVFLDWLAADRQWKNIRAVREGQVRYFPKDFYGWDAPDVRWVLGLTWMAAVLHPARFPGYDIAAEVRSFYGELYGLDEATIDAAIVPLIKTDFR